MCPKKLMRYWELGGNPLKTLWLNRTLTWSALCLAMLVSFQNCSFPGFKGFGNVRTSAFGAIGGGEGYEGKTYILLAANPCVDNNPVKSRIVTSKGNVPMIVRDNCQDLAAAIPATGATLSGQQINYQNLAYDLESVSADILGERTKLSAGNYAPSVFSLDTGPTVAMQGAPMGSNYILTVSSASSVFPF